MRKEFNELVETMKRWDLFQKDDEVDMALNDLGAKIDEVEKRIECAVRSAKEINESISKYTEEIDDELPIKMSVNDHDLIQNCSDDVRIALDLNDDMSIVDNWYDLFIGIKPIDLGEVPIKKKTFMSFESSWGNIACDEDGNVIEVIGYGEGEVIDAENYLFDIVKFDLVEYGKFCESINITMSEFDDILIVGFWKKDGTYEEADMDWRKNIFGDAPTVLCQSQHTHDLVRDIIGKLKVIEVDGETMEYILRQVGMEEQMLKQLFTQSTNDDIDYLHDVRNGKG